MFQDEPPPPEAFRDPSPLPPLSAITIDNPLYHIVESVKEHSKKLNHHHTHQQRSKKSGSPKQTKTAPCSPQHSKQKVTTENIPYGKGSRHDLCSDCYEEGKELLQSTQRDFINFNKNKEEFKRQMCFAGKLYRYVSKIS